MTSGTMPGPRRRPPRSDGPRGRAASRRRRPDAPLRPAFTLLELALALSLVVALAIAGRLAFGGWDSQAAFEQGVERFQAALRMARADAANQGRRLRLQFDEEGFTQILWEPKPLEEPGVFTDYEGCLWRDMVPRDLARVSRCELIGSSAYRTVTHSQEAIGVADQVELSPLTFYSDGTCEEALLELRPPGESDSRRAVIQISARGGIVSARIVNEQELQEYYDQIQSEQAPSEDQLE